VAKSRDGSDRNLRGARSGKGFRRCLIWSPISLDSTGVIDQDPLTEDQQAPPLFWKRPSILGAVKDSNLGPAD
jgi:hypothetical protein